MVTYFSYTILFILSTHLIKSQAYIRPPAVIKLFRNLSLEFNKLHITCPSSESNGKEQSFTTNISLTDNDIVDLKPFELPRNLPSSCTERDFLNGKISSDYFDINVLFINYEYIKTEQVFFLDQGLQNDSGKAIKLKDLLESKVMKHNNLLKLYIKTTNWYIFEMVTTTNVLVNVETIDDSTFKVINNKTEVKEKEDFVMNVTGTMFIKVELENDNEIGKFLETEIKLSKDIFKEDMVK